MPANEVHNVTVTPDEIVARLSDPVHLLCAPSVDPFSASEMEVLGQSALEQIMARVLARRVQTKGIKNLTLVLPPAQIADDMQEKIAGAVQRYCAAKIEDNNLRIRASLSQSLTKLTIVAVVIASLIVVAALFFYSGVLSTEKPLGNVVAFSLGVLVWVSLWDPLSSLGFGWIPWYRENRMLERIAAMQIAVRPQVQPEPAARAGR